MNFNEKLCLDGKKKIFHCKVKIRLWKSELTICVVMLQMSNALQWNKKCFLNMCRYKAESSHPLPPWSWVTACYGSSHRWFLYLFWQLSQLIKLIYATWDSFGFASLVKSSYTSCFVALYFWQWRKFPSWQFYCPEEGFMSPGAVWGVKTHKVICYIMFFSNAVT